MQAAIATPTSQMLDGGRHGIETRRVAALTRALTVDGVRCTAPPHRLNAFAA